MKGIQFQLVQPNDHPSFQLIAEWYLSEWKVPIEKTIQRLKSITSDPAQFQVLMTFDNKPVATGGVYDHVGLLDREPRFKVYKSWLALVYTSPESRQKGYGALLCDYIQEHAKHAGIQDMYLFTDTAERLYERLGWAVLERVAMGERNVVVMKKELLSKKEQ